MSDQRKGNWGHRKKKTISLEGDSSSRGSHTAKDSAVNRRPGKKPPLTSSPSTQNLALEQLQETFTPAMAHATYIPFCKLLGQISLNTELRNTELIEHIAYGYDAHARDKTRQLPSVFLSSEDEDSSSSNSDSEDSMAEDTRGGDEELARDVTIKLGPVEALQQKRGLDRDAVSFGRSNWFVDLNQEVVGGEMGGVLSTSTGEGAGVAGGVERGNESLVATVTGVSTGAGGVVGGIGVSSVVGEVGATRSMGVGVGGEDGGGGRGWMEGMRGSAMATASGILNLIQSRPPTEMTQSGRGSKVDDITRHSINFDMKFQSIAGPLSSVGGSTDSRCAIAETCLLCVLMCKQLCICSQSHTMCYSAI